MLHLGGDGSLDQLPAWLSTMATEAGVELRGHRWRFLPGGDYWSQKAVFLLHRGPGKPPDVVVKVCRSRQFGARLVTEHAALGLVASAALTATTVPRVLFLGSHCGMTVLAQSAVVGRPLASSLSADEDCEVTRLALHGLLEIALGTTPIQRVDAAAAATALAAIVDRFVQAYPGELQLRRFLDRQVAAVARSPVPFPAVFQHGDAGVWNLLVTDAGTLGVLDWENAEPGGVPLWDLFYFAQTRGSRLTAAAGHRYTAATFASQLHADSPHRRLLVTEVQRWLDATGLDPSLVGPLFHLCWAHHAAKEASRLPAGRLRRRGRYLRLLAAAAASEDQARLSPM